MEAAESEIVSIDECGFQKRNEKVGENKFHESQNGQGNGGYFSSHFSQESAKSLSFLLLFFNGICFNKTNCSDSKKKKNLGGV